MLKRLLIENLAVFERVEVDLTNGLNVISGESGAGKTMLVRALEMLFGASADSSLIGPFGDDAYIEAVFEGDVPVPLQELIGDKPQEFTLARILRAGGPSRALVNGRSASAQILAKSRDDLLEMSGQHSARRLVSPAHQLELLDPSGPLVEEVSELYSQWKQAERKEREIRESLLDGERKLDFLRHEVELYDEVSPVPGEVETLESERRKLESAADYREALTRGAALILSDGGAADKLSEAHSLISSLGDDDDGEGAQAEALAESVRELGRSVRAQAEGMTSDPVRLEEVNSRLASINDLRRRFKGAELEEIQQRIEATRAELEAIQGGDQALEDATSQTARCEGLFMDKARELSKARNENAKRLSQETTSYLPELGMDRAVMKAQVKETGPSLTGIDEAVFTLQANKGLDPVMLGKGASGGELSRVNLALYLAGEGASSYFFDEIDAGIGGHTAHSVASKLADLATSGQVTAITHLAQIAVKADHHLLIAKADDDALTRTSVTPLDNEGKEREIARLIGASEHDAKVAGELLGSHSSSS